MTQAATITDEQIGTTVSAGYDPPLSSETSDEPVVPASEGAEGDGSAAAAPSSEWQSRFETQQREFEQFKAEHAALRASYEQIAPRITEEQRAERLKPWQEMQETLGLLDQSALSPEEQQRFHKLAPLAAIGLAAQQGDFETVLSALPAKHLTKLGDVATQNAAFEYASRALESDPNASASDLRELYKELITRDGNELRYGNDVLMRQGAELWVRQRRAGFRTQRLESGAERMEPVASGSGAAQVLSDGEWLRRWGLPDGGGIPSTRANAEKAERLMQARGLI